MKAKLIFYQRATLDNYYGALKQHWSQSWSSMWLTSCVLVPKDHSFLSNNIDKKRKAKVLIEISLDY
ncbi:hypothetical protein FRX31_019819 [Thalictrum thalictroides]|uniref:Uncharacterized protein n=1 Tax=Thalictrum thalictroides TaxID=46969 RepID=A0A7J6W2R2_THATH|nr:hypothetical protein FRX31_019819 [Thalictrum thalictroides]